MKIEEFKKNQDFIVCIDSDGCAMDTMNIKHFRCFGPCMIEEWDLFPWEAEILKRWNEINLYSLTRGINRFKGLALCLSEINQTKKPIEGIEALLSWSREAEELSNAGLQKMLDHSPIFAKALHWSTMVNAAIEKLPEDEVKPFDGVKEALESIHAHCDIAVVSSANPEAVRKEWDRFGLLSCVDVVCTQDVGPKAVCIRKLAEKGYAKDRILMVGDAPGDLKAAEENEVFFYPILVNKEADSWQEFRTTALTNFIHQDYPAYGKEKIAVFRENLK